MLRTLKSIKPVKPVCGFIFGNEEIYNKAKNLLIGKLGEIDFESQIINFNFTDYYEKEMGRNLKRAFFSFRRLINPEKIVEIKEFTMKIEKRFSLQEKRRVNIDPGYISLAQLVLVSTKPYFHRILLKKKIFAEVTLFYRDKSFRYFDWTYPDYRRSEYIQIFNRIREVYKNQLKDRKI